ncbi:MAG: HipA domain-containing protein [Vibrio sp.]
MSVKLMTDNIACIDVSDWKGDENQPFFAIGARDKQMIWSPNIEHLQHDILKPDWPYLFKQSIQRYPDQYWTEIIASIVGYHLGLPVPKSFPAEQRQEDGKIISGCLMEWFYDPRKSKLDHASSHFKQLIKDFDNNTGSQHNLAYLMVINKTVYNAVKVISKENNTEYQHPDVIGWLIDMIAFDTLIGNTDRHQENWGFVISGDGVSLSHLYDNGTSLGHERFIHNIQNWDDNRLKRYIHRAKHHIKYDLGDNMKRIPHFELLQELKSGEIIQFPKPIRLTMLKAIKLIITAIDLPALLYDIRQLPRIECQSPISQERIDWVERIIVMRYELMKEQLDDVY